MQLTIKHSPAGREPAGEASAAEPAIQTRGLNIHYGSFHAVRDIDLAKKRYQALVNARKRR